MTSIGFIGLGAMGSRMARRLVDAGFDVAVWNRDPRKAEGFPDVASTPSEAAAGRDVVIAMVSDPAALAAVSAELVPALSPGAVVVQMSTVSRGAVERLAAALPEGVDLLDAPVLGSLPEAEAGGLKIFVGGDPTVLERVSAVLSVLGEAIHVGPLGAGTAAKLVANSTLFGVLAVLGESLALAERQGLSRADAFDVLAATPLAAQAERRRPWIEAGEYPTRFALTLALKDAELVREAGAASGAELRAIEAARTWLRDAEEAGRGGEDYSAVLAQILSR